MVMSIIVMIMMMMSLTNTIMLASFILIVSMISSLQMYKEMFSSWMPLVLIITFSSGMMILFMYATSLAPIEKQKSSKMLFLLLVSTMMVMVTNKTIIPDMKTSMKMFSSQMTIMLISIMLIMTILTISKMSFNPMKSMDSTF